MRLLLPLAAITLLTLPVAAQPFHHSAGEWREYKQDWLAACPDAINEDAEGYYFRSCFASTGSQDLNDANLPAYKLTLIRDRLDGDVDLAITIAPSRGEYDETRPMILRFSGEPDVELDMGTTLETRDNVINQFFVVGPDRDALIDRLKGRNAVTLLVPLVGSADMVEARLSLRGVMASLDFMDANARKVAQY